MLKTALALAARGFHVFQCVPRGKMPATPHGCKDATTDATVITAWWTRRPDCNIAIATGVVSGIFVLDIDGSEAEATLHRLEAVHREPLPATVEVISTRGRHCYFKMPTIPVRNSAGKIGKHLDIRADAGYVLAPPSIHPSGRRYAWSVDSARALADAPTWLIEKIAAPTAAETAPAAPPSEFRSLVCEGVGEGARNTSAARLAGYLLRRRVDPFVTLDLIQMWNVARCVPPLPATDIAQVVNSIAALELARRHGGRDDG
jgi:hypothetical protein